MILKMSKGNDMALILCDECQTEISDKSKQCIHCGAPIGDSLENTALVSKHKIDELIGVIVNINERNDIPWRYKIMVAGGYGFFANENVEISEGSEEQPDLKNGSYVKFKPILTNGRIKNITILDDVKEEVKNSFEKDVKFMITDDLGLQRMVEKLSGVNTDDEKITKKYIWQIIVIVLLVGYWIAKGTPNPALFFAGSTAKEECLNLANDNLDSFMFFGSSEIEARDTWIKNGKRVVQLIQENDGKLQQIMCVYGNGVVQIPSLFEQGRWR